MIATALSPADLTDPDVHVAGAAHDLWRWMRQHCPLRHHPATDLPAFWSLTRHADIRAVYRDPARFSSAPGVLLRPGADPGAGMTLALTDPPRHKQLRSLVAGWFSQRTARDLVQPIRSAVRATLAVAAAEGRCDVVFDIAARLSTYVICTLLGVPGNDHERVFEWTNEAYAAHVPLAAQHDLMAYFGELMYDRMEHPADDITSALANGELDGCLISEREILLNCENLVGATENGRLAIAAGVEALLAHPVQWRRLCADRALIPAAVEEILRWTSSATHSVRTAARDTELRGHRIVAGDKVVLWLPSANRDEDVFADPYTFDVGRTPNHHLALGTGEHFCLGAVLARTQLRVLLTELLEAKATFELLGEPRRVRSIAVSGPETLPIRVTRMDLP